MPCRALRPACNRSPAASHAGTCPPAAVYTAGDYLPLLEDARCAFPACPCAGGRARCEALEAGTLNVPAGRATVIQIVRNPIDVVLSAFAYHSQVLGPQARTP